MANTKDSAVNIDRDDCFCQFCNKQCKNLNALKQHEIRCKDNPNRINLDYYKTRDNSKCGWSRGLTKETNSSILNHSLFLTEYYKTHKGTFKGKHHTQESKDKLSTIARENNYQQHFGLRKVYMYKDYKFQSSYEVQVAEDLDRNNIIWEKPKYGLFKYTDTKGKLHTYTPDFYLPDYDIYLDPKNDYLINNINPTLGYSDYEKITWVCEQNNVKIIILNSHQLTWESIVELI